MFLSINSFSQVSNDTITAEKSVFRKLLGDELESSVTFMPFATHVITRVNLEFPYYLGVNYKGFELTTFKNTFGDFCFGANYKRKWRFSPKFSINYTVGLIYGYGDDLANLEQLPESLKGVVDGDVVPVIGLDFVYEISDKFAVLSILAPNVLMLGGRYYL